MAVQYPTTDVYSLQRTAVQMLTSLAELETQLAAIQLAVSEDTAVLQANALVPVFDEMFGTLRWRNEEVPDGGTVGQVLTKASAVDYDVQWRDPFREDLTPYLLASVASTTYLSRVGGTMLGPISWAGLPTSGQHLVNRQFVEQYTASLFSDNTAALDARYVRQIGGTVTGPIRYAGAPVLATELVNKTYVDALLPFARVASGGEPGQYQLLDANSGLPGERRNVLMVLNGGEPGDGRRIAA